MIRIQEDNPVVILLCSFLIVLLQICEEEDISAARSYISSMKQGSNMKREVIKSLEVIDQA
jgi:hypothetical protein